MSKVRICHMTSAHNSKDIRIFTKECTSLAEAGYEVYLVANGDIEIQNQVHIVGCKYASKSRVYRMLKGSKLIYTAAKELNCDIYHIHDPELLRYAIKLKKQGKKVIFDSHEDVPSQIIDKTWIPSIMRSIVATLYKCYETYVVKHIDAVVAATPHIADQFTHRAKKIVVVNNYPRLDDIKFQTKPFSERERIICYAGGISPERGENVMIEAMKHVDGTLLIAGNHKKEVIDFTAIGGGRVEYLGKLNREEINKLYAASCCGLILLKPTKAYLKSLPIKMFEYMAAGIPYIASDFVYWEKLLPKSIAGLYVDINNIDIIVKMIQEILNNPQRCMEMGKNGRLIVESTYNWGNAKKELLRLYCELE